MKYHCKLLTFLLVVFTICILSGVNAMAADNSDTDISEGQEVAANSEDDVLSFSSSIKAGTTISLKKSLGLTKKAMKKYTFSTDDPKVATVSDDGIVTGVKKGSTTITLTSVKDDSTYAEVSTKVKACYTKKQLRLMSAIIYSEAGGECMAGKKAVGIVIMNRLNSSMFPNTLHGVIYQKRQFTPVRNGSLNSSLAMYDNGTMTSSCIKAARYALEGNTTISYKGSNINMDRYLYFNSCPCKNRLRIKHHYFG